MVAAAPSAFRTLQERLPKELALAGVMTLEAADRFYRRALPARAQRRFRDRAGRGRQRLCARPRRRRARDPVP